MNEYITRKELKELLEKAYYEVKREKLDKNGYPMPVVEDFGKEVFRELIYILRED